MKRILIDTDVILDFFFDKRPFSDNAATILSYCENNTIQGFVTPVIISNIYYLLKRTSTHEKVVRKLEQLLTIIDILSMNGAMVRMALKSGFRDFEDALQNFTASADGTINAIITRNVKDYSQSDLGIMTPHDFIQTFSIAES